MKPGIFTLIIVMLSAAALAPRQLAAQETRYKVIVLPTFGGPQSFVSINGIADVKGAYLRVLNNDGTVTGAAETSTPDPDPNFCATNDCFVAHAFRWRDGVMTDLGALPGNVSSANTVVSASGLIAGNSENPFDIDPVLGFPVFRGTLWKDSSITDLGALSDEGGHTSPANGLNSSGQVIGFAFDATPDPYSMIGVGFQTRAYVWQNGVMRDIGTLGGPDAQALAINEKGQVVGDSYINFTFTQNDFCTGLPLTIGAFIWENDLMHNIGTLGGSCTSAVALNNRGQITGQSALAGDQATHPYLWEQGSMKDLGTFGGSFGLGNALNEAGKVVGVATYPGDMIFRAALWRDGEIKDIGTLPGDAYSWAVDINARGQIIGWSADAQFTRVHAFLWEEGRPMLDLDSLLEGFGLQLGIGVLLGVQGSGPANINDRGEIVGNALDANNLFHAVLLVPCGNVDTDCQDVSSMRIQANAANTPKSVVIANELHLMVASGGIPALMRARMAHSHRSLLR